MISLGSACSWFPFRFRNVSFLSPPACEKKRTGINLPDQIHVKSAITITSTKICTVQRKVIENPEKKDQGKVLTLKLKGIIN